MYMSLSVYVYVYVYVCRRICFIFIKYHDMSLKKNISISGYSSVLLDI
jgi:hypothetical protein